MQDDQDQVATLDQPQRFYRRLERSGFPVTLVGVTSVRHGFDLVVWRPDCPELIQRIANCFDQRLRKQSQRRDGKSPIRLLRQTRIELFYKLRFVIARVFSSEETVEGFFI